MFDPGVGEGGISQKSPDFPCTPRGGEEFLRGRRRRIWLEGDDDEGKEEEVFFNKAPLAGNAHLCLW